MRRVKLVLILLSVCAVALLVGALPVSAELIWSEDFSSQEGKGADGTGTDMTGITKWSLDVSSCILVGVDDFCKVLSGQFVSQDNDGEMVWTTESIDISAHANVALSIALSEEGNLFGTEYIRCYYKLDGGAETLFETNGDMTDDFTAATASQSGLSGSTLQIVVKSKSTAGTRRHLFDNVTVTGDLLSTEPTTHATSLIFSAVTNVQMGVSWSSGDGAFRIVVMKAGGAVAGAPADGVDYDDDPFLTGGSAIATGEYVVYSGNGTNVTVTGLSPGLTYHVSVFEFNGGGSGINYLTSGTPLAGSQATETYAPAITEGTTVSVVMSENATPVAFALTLNATDPDPDDTITWSVGATAEHGTPSVSGTGTSRTIAYVPNAYYSGQDRFTVKATDSYGNSDVIVVTVGIAAVNVPGKPVFIFE